MNHTRISTALALAGALLLTAAGNAGAGPVSSAGLSRIDGLSAIEFVQAKPKSETVKQKVKRVWRNLTGYKFDVACPIILPFVVSVTHCTATGKNREVARTKCQSQHPFCAINVAR
jgi:hypothetical protein